MIEPLTQSSKEAFGFKVTGMLTADDMVGVGQCIEAQIAANGMPIGLLVDLSEMQGATWAARWEEMRFLQTHSDRIVRLAVVSDDQWEDIKEMTLVATAAMQAETRYFLSTEALHAWHWAKHGDPGEGVPVRVMYPGKGLFGDYTPEYVGI
jgi:hypothetical protein